MESRSLVSVERDLGTESTSIPTSSTSASETFEPEINPDETGLHSPHLFSSFILREGSSYQNAIRIAILQRYGIKFLQAKTLKIAPNLSNVSPPVNGHQM